MFALASFAEGVPVSLMEAMASEVPCVSTLITGIPELIRDEIDGLLVSPSDEEALAGALRRLMDQPELRRRLGKAGRQRVIDRYNLDKNVRVLAEVYHCRLHDPYGKKVRGPSRVPLRSLVVIVSFNTREVLRRCLNTLAADAKQLSVEVLVVDNASRDGSVEMVASDFPQVRLLQAGRNLGFAAAE